MKKPSADERADASRLVTVAGHIASNRRTTLPGRGRLARASAQTQNVKGSIRLSLPNCNVFLEADPLKESRGRRLNLWGDVVGSPPPPSKFQLDRPHPGGTPLIRLMVPSAPPANYSRHPDAIKLARLCR